jgi:thiol-disulfide isomerase/thioredoxin
MRGWMVRLIAIALIVAGCAAGPRVAESAGTPSASSSSVPSPTAAPPSASVTPGPTPAPAWMTDVLTDVRSGATLRIADLAGKVVFLEGMATWCPPCVTQQDQADVALRQLAPGSVVYISLDVDPREDRKTLETYAASHHFSWEYVIGMPALLRDLDAAFGDLVLSPPATPIIVIDATGTAALTETGIKSWHRLVEIAHAHGA